MLFLLSLLCDLWSQRYSFDVKYTNACIGVRLFLAHFFKKYENFSLKTCKNNQVFIYLQ